MKAKSFLAVSILLALVGCGNDSSDKPVTPDQPLIPLEPSIPVVPPTDPDEKPELEGFLNAASIDLSVLSGEQGQALIDGIEEQLNDGLTAKTGQFRIVPKWGMDNLTVVQDGEAYVLETNIDPEVFSMPTEENQVTNGFSFLIEMPNGLVKEAAIQYKAKWSTGYKQSPDYIFMGGFTSGDPLVENKPTVDGQGFTYKLNLDKYGYMNTRFADPTDNKFFNSQILNGGAGLRVDGGQWHQFQIDVATNDFVDSVATKDGSVVMSYNGQVVTSKAGDVLNRTMIDAEHNYKLNGLFEFYRHYKHGSDDQSKLKEQKIQITDLVIGWNNEVVTLPDVSEPEPEVPPTSPCDESEEDCWDNGFTNPSLPMIPVDPSEPVEPEPEAPVIEAIAPIVIMDSDITEFQVVATDPNDAVLNYSLSEDVPTWVTIEADTGLILFESFVPTGDYSFSVNVSNDSLSTTANVTVKVAYSDTALCPDGDESCSNVDDGFNQPLVPNACSEMGENTRVLDLTELVGMTGQSLVDAISNQLGGAKNGNTPFSVERLNMFVIEHPETKEPVLKVVFPAAAKGNVSDNGTNFRVGFPTTETAMTNACIAYDMMFDKDVVEAGNHDEIYVPSLSVMNGSSVYSAHRYSTNKYRRLSANFYNPPHGDFGSWLDNGKNKTVFNSDWNNIKQTIEVGENGNGFIDFVLNGETYFQADPNKFDGLMLNEAEMAIAPTDKVSKPAFAASFDLQRRGGVGVEDQVFYFKNLVIGW